MTGAQQPLSRVQDRLVRLLGNSVEGRGALVAGMLHRNPSEATSYWLQLVVSIGIATLGLVVGSSAVVIGAMLVAPLMGPIVGLAMGLATGSPFLVLRSAGRIALSVLGAVGGAALITLLLPFHELNPEIAARASPTVLDLVTAGFCAMAAVYASLRPGSDTATTAAGTAISISLVPPLCASGYGVGTANWPVAWGAALLFLTNLVAIVVVGTALFVAAGFNRVDVVTLERDELAQAAQDAPLARALARRLARLFESRAGPLLRFLMPFALLAAVYVPLRRALDEVAWQVTVRAGIQEALAREPARLVQSRVRVERHQVEVVLVLLGKTRDAEAVRARLERQISRLSGVAPRVEILAVPDATAFASLEATLHAPSPPTPVAVAAATPPEEQLRSALARVRSVVAAHWPAAHAGRPLAIEVDSTAADALRIRVLHVGPALSADGGETLRRVLEAGLASRVQLVDQAIAPVLGSANGELALLDELAVAVAAAASLPELAVCVTRPREPTRGGARGQRELAGALDRVLARHPRVSTQPGAAWEIRFVAGACFTAEAEAASAR